MISTKHKHRFEDIRKDLASIGAKEGVFIKVELLFYEAISIAREYGDEIASNTLLAALKQLQTNEYQQTKSLFKKNTQRERVIQRFISGFRTVLTAAMKNTFSKAEPT